MSVIKTYISNLVYTMRFWNNIHQVRYWNNIHQVRSKPEYMKGK